MSDLLQSGASWLATTLRNHAAQTVTYRRPHTGGSQSVELAATIGRSEIEEQQADGTLVKYEIRDYLIDVADLVLAGVAVLPEDGDLIEETLGGATAVYEILRDGDEPWRYSDVYHTRLRIHTKRIK